MVRIRTFAVCAACVFLLVAACRKSRQPVEDVRMLMDTVVRISLHGTGMPEKEVRSVIDSTFRLMQKLENELSVHVDSSAVSLCMRRAGQGPVQVPAEVAGLIQTANALSRASSGAFDISVGVLEEVWGFYTETPHVPATSLVQEKLRLVNYRDIEVAQDRVFLKMKGMRFDLGAIAKGYIIDRAVGYLKEKGATAGIVDAGGDIRIFGSPPHRNAWRIGILHPRSEDKMMYGVLNVGECAIATSGDYERYFFEDGRRFHHIMDPATGFPASKCVSATVIAETATEADGWATALFVMGPEGLEILSRNHLEGLVIYEGEEGLHHRGTPLFLEKLALSEE